MPEWVECPLRGRNGSVEACNHAPQRPCRPAAEQGSSVWGQALRGEGGGWCRPLHGWPQMGLWGKSWAPVLTYSSSPACSLLPFLHHSFLSLFLPPSPSFFFFLLPPATPQTCLRCSGRPCPFDDALRCWVIAQAAPSAWKGPMAPSPGCLKPCPLPMPSKPPATPHPPGSCLNLFLLESFTGKRLSLCPPGKAGAIWIFSYMTFPTTFPGCSVLG